MWGQVREAAKRGIILGVEWGLALLIVLFAVSWFLNDHTVVRDMARHGEQAFQYIAQAQQNAAKTPQENGGKK